MLIRHATVVAAAVALSSLLWTPGLRAQTAASRPIVQQQFDSSCGLASLATLLAWAGSRTTEEDLQKRMLEIFSPDEALKALLRERGLSVSELVKVIADQQLRPIEKNRTISQLRQVLRVEPVIAMVYFSSDPRHPGHFTVVMSAREDGGFELADPALGPLALSESEFEERFVRRNGGGVSFVVRRQDGGPLIPEWSEATKVRGMERPLTGIQSQLLRIGTSQLQMGKTSIEADIKRIVSPRLNLLNADGIRVTSRQVQSLTAISVRHGLNDSVQLSASVPMESSSDSTYVQVEGTKFSETTRTSSFARSVDLQVIARLWESGDRSGSFASSGGISLSRHGKVLSLSAGVSATLMPNNSFVSLIGGTIGWVHFPRHVTGNEGLSIISIGSTVVVPLRPNVDAFLALQADVPQRSLYARTKSLQVGLNFALTQHWSISPYIGFDRTEGQVSRGLGVGVRHVLPRSML